MDWNEIQGKWAQYKGQIKQKWGELTDSDLDRIAGKRDELAGFLQERYGITREQAQRDVDEYAASLRPAENVRAGASSTGFFNESIRGRKVITADGQSVGEIGDLIIDTKLWRVESLQLKLNKDTADKLGVHRGKFHAGTIDLPVHMIQSIGDTIVLSVPTSELRPTLRGAASAAA